MIQRTMYNEQRIKTKLSGQYERHDRYPTTQTTNNTVEKQSDRSRPPRAIGMVGKVANLSGQCARSRMINMAWSGQ